MALGPPVATKPSGFAVGFCGDRGPRAMYFTHHGKPWLKPITMTSILVSIPITHLPLDKMAVILQTIFSDAFSWMNNNFKRAGIIFASIKSVYTPLFLRIHPTHLALLYDYTFVLLCSPDSADYITMGDAPQNGINGNHCDVADVPTYSWPGAETDAEAARVAALGYKPGISSTCVRQHYDNLSLDYDDVNWSYICDDLNSVALVLNHRHSACEYTLGLFFTKKSPFYWYKESHYKPEMVVRRS